LRDDGLYGNLRDLPPTFCVGASGATKNKIKKIDAVQAERYRERKKEREKEREEEIQRAGQTK